MREIDLISCWIEDAMCVCARLMTYDVSTIYFEDLPA